MGVPSVGATFNIKQQIGSVYVFYRCKALYVSCSQHRLPEYTQKPLGSQKMKDAELLFRFSKLQ